MKAHPISQERKSEGHERSGAPAVARFPKMEPGPRPTRLNTVSEDALLDMRAGDLIFLDESAVLRPMVESVFFAVLSCPCCGILGLIMLPQYLGNQPVICGADDCSCRFRILEKARIEFLPAS
ncbi:MAG TPA: hypothetical protein VG028_17060 [Terriglobia bacterium]|nr:hypothetical protein [Terriglobia bacterium]